MHSWKQPYVAISSLLKLWLVTFKGNFHPKAAPDRDSLDSEKHRIGLH